MTEKSGVERSTATEVLRRLLDERGGFRVDFDREGARRTCWKIDDEQDGYCYFDEDSFGATQLTVTRATPEQAIAATLGATDARPTQAESSGTCHDVGDPSDFCCSECGVRMFTEANDTYTMIASDERTIIKRPNYCPNCGRRCVG